MKYENTPEWKELQRQLEISRYGDDLARRGITLDGRIEDAQRGWAGHLAKAQDAYDRMVASEEAAMVARDRKSRQAQARRARKRA
jgi:hypothetical protein